MQCPGDVRVTETQISLKGNIQNTELLTVTHTTLKFEVLHDPWCFPPTSLLPYQVHYLAVRLA